jgi:hypothetical protein
MIVAEMVNSMTEKMQEADRCRAEQEICGPHNLLVYMVNVSKMFLDLYFCNFHAM